MDDIELIPVYVNDEIQLYDIYVKQQWCGSRRTKEAALTFLRKKETENHESL